MDRIHQDIEFKRTLKHIRAIKAVWLDVLVLDIQVAGRSSK